MSINIRKFEHELSSLLPRGINSLLPQNAHSKNVAEMTRQVETLNDALKDKTSLIFQNKLVETQNKLKNGQKDCTAELKELNGSFFQDPASLLKQAWDLVVNTVKAALGKEVVSRGELEGITTELKTTPEDLAAAKAIEDFIQLEKKRDLRKKQLETLIGIEKTGSEATSVQDALVKERDALLKRQKELCGHYYGDANSLLDQAWKAYQNVPTDNQYHKLEIERKSNDATLFTLEQHLAFPTSSDRTIEDLTAECIAFEIKTLEEKKKVESKQAGVDLLATVTSVIGFVAGSAGDAESTTEFFI
jgi:hypothetical protein